MKRSVNQPLNRRKGIMQMAMIAVMFCVFAAVLPEWSNRSTQMGAMVALGCLVVLILAIVFRRIRRLNKRQLADAKRQYTVVTSWTVASFIVLNLVVLRYYFENASFIPYIVGFGAIFMIGVSIIAVCIPVLRLGVYQDSK